MQNSLKSETKDIKLRVVLINDTLISGTLNMVGYKRFSDFIEEDENKYLRLYNAITGGNHLGFILIPKSQVLFYEPLENKKKLLCGVS